ncbi:MAG: class II fructose-bisphosphate aldolase [Candidatus Harrisonbacteria bacterium]|nr:class II fructose-bisphosphate aldolase [Candidatus Harrisonbacteria bacterium]
MVRNLKKLLAEAEKKKIAIGHFNIGELEMLKAISHVAQRLDVPVIIGTSEGERDYLGIHHTVDLIKSYNQEHGHRLFLNADHTHSMEKAKAAVDVGYDAVLFDGGKLPLEENIRKTKEIVEYAKAKNKKNLVEGEIGDIGSGSTIRKEIPKGAAIKPEDLTKPEDAKRFVKETGVDLLAPAVGNIHGMFADAPEPALDIERIRAIRKAAGVPLVLHGGSGNTDEDFLAAIDAGVSIIHISTELRVAWRRGIEAGLKKNPEEITPYKVVPEAIEEIEKVVENRLRLFNRL